MAATGSEPVGCPAWVPKDAQLYLFHTEQGMSLREIARVEGCHPSTILRKVRAFENRRDDPLIDEALIRIGAQVRPADQDIRPPHAGDLAPMTAPFRPQPAATAQGIPDEASLRREARRILRRLAETDTVLAVSPEMAKAVVMKGELRLAIVDRQVVEAFALKDWIEVVRPGRIATYGITGAGRSWLRRVLAEDLHPAGLAEAPTVFGDQHRIWDERQITDGGAARRIRVNISESPVQMLARRREKDGTPFLPADLVAAAERLREDFELAQMGPHVAQNWDRFLTSPDRGPFRDAIATDGAGRARDRLALALRDLGPGLGDVVLRCCCYLEGMEAVEERLGWSARSGKVVLRIALTRLKRHYDEVYGGKMPMIG